MISLLPNFHFDLTWHKNAATFLRLSAQIFQEALDLLDTDPEYRFTIDHLAFIEWFLEQHPEQAGRVRGLVRSGRLAVVGGMVSMMDCDIPDGETIARQLLYGQRGLEGCLGKRAEVGWLIDNYGYNPQLPQLLRLAGMEALEICLWWAPPEYLAEHIRRSEFLWQGLDGSQVLVHVAMPNYSGPALPGGRSYEDPPAPFDPAHERELAEAGLEDWLQSIRPWATGDELCGHVGGDFRHPLPQLSRYIGWWNERPGSPPARLGVPEDFFRALAVRQAGLPVLSGEISPPMHKVVKTPGVLRAMAERVEAGQHVRPVGLGRFGEGYGEAKVERKQLDRVFHSAVRQAEAAATWASLLGATPVQEAIAALYHPVLVYGHHDPFIGCCVVDDYERQIELLRSSIQKAQARGRQALAFIAAQVDTRGPGQPFLVFNPLTPAGAGPASLSASFDPGQAQDVEIVNSVGEPVLSQVVDVTRHPDGSLARAQVLCAAEPPDYGHQVYNARPALQGDHSEEHAWSKTDPRVLENPRYRLEFSPSGSIETILDKAAGLEILGQGGAELVLEEDLGCFCHIDPTGKAWRQSENPPAQVEILERGPLRWRLAASAEFDLGGERERLAYRQEISLYSGLPRIDFHVMMEIPSGEDLRAVFRFALPGKCGEVWAETPFGALQRGEELAHAINWVDCTGDAWGLALLNRGLAGYEVRGETLSLSLWRGLSLYSDCFGCLPRLQRAPLIERGRREFHFALLPHAGDWRLAGLPRAGVAFNQPLQVLPEAAHPGRLPARHAWLGIDPENILLAAAKRAEAGEALVLRLYESSGLATRARLQPPEGFTRWAETNILEDPRPWKSLNGAELELRFKPFEVKTILLDK